MELFVITEQLLDQLDADFMGTLETSLGDFKTALKENIKNRWDLETSMLFLLQVSPYAVLFENDTTKTFLVLFKMVLIEFLIAFSFGRFMVFWIKTEETK